MWPKSKTSPKTESWLKFKKWYGVCIMQYLDYQKKSSLSFQSLDSSYLLNYVGYAWYSPLRRINAEHFNRLTACASKFNWQRALNNWQPFYLNFDINLGLRVCCFGNKGKFIWASWRHVLACLEMCLTLGNEWTMITTLSVRALCQNNYWKNRSQLLICASSWLIWCKTSYFTNENSLNNFKVPLRQSNIMWDVILFRNKTGTQDMI